MADSDTTYFFRLGLIKYPKQGSDLWDFDLSSPNPWSVAPRIEIRHDHMHSLNVI